MTNNQKQFNNQNISSFSQWLINNKIVKNQNDAQALLGLILIIVVFILYWFFFIKSDQNSIDPVLIENAGSPEEIINS